ncbi:hypothetical protein K490DRAFT_69103 [Saccharata proteae CBS 121410]|uniref:Uncharacterized protein n=1 Tax=Saccharata proteae CBS 121410 TaxID=1314787 RepID=A0A9P4HRM8_9PEZI|nr:hypothetical protein K490DRAFT_69103 [Saccharata proteae CBS 121410]
MPKSQRREFSEKPNKRETWSALTKKRSKERGKWKTRPRRRRMLLEEAKQKEEARKLEEFNLKLAQDLTPDTMDKLKHILGKMGKKEDEGGQGGVSKEQTSDRIVDPSKLAAAREPRREDRKVQASDDRVVDPSKLAAAKEERRKEKEEEEKMAKEDP